MSLFDTIPTTKVTLKKKTSPNSPTALVPWKKATPVSPSAPFLDGVLGKLYFSLAKVHSYSDIPEGKSIIINHFCKALPHEHTEGSYILIDAFDNLWSAPEVLLKWREDVDSSCMKELNLNTYWLSLAHMDGEYQLYTLLKRDSYKAVLHPAAPSFKSSCTTKDEEEEEEAFPMDDSDSDFQQNNF